MVNVGFGWGHSSARKALALSIAQEDIGQGVTLAEGTTWLSSTITVYSWIKNILNKNNDAA